jgi:hypothetical protein
MDATFETASRFLQQRSIPAFPDAHDRLVGFVRMGRIVEAFKECFPEKMPDTGPLDLSDLDGEKAFALQEAAIQAVAALFPVLDETMDTLLQEGEPLYIHPDSCGYAWDDEWLSELFQNPDDLPADSALAMFFKTIWIATMQFRREDGRSLWDSIQGHFGYPCDMPEVGNVYARDFNWPLLHELLDQNDLGDFKTAIKLALCDTGNIFLDASPDDYGYGTTDIPDFTAENIKTLRELWQEAEKLLAEYEQCRLRVIEDPQIYARLAQTWESACRTPLQPDPPKTLAEVFSGQEGDEDGNHQPIL